MEEQELSSEGGKLFTDAPEDDVSFQKSFFKPFVEYESFGIRQQLQVFSLSFRHHTFRNFFISFPFLFSMVSITAHVNCLAVVVITAKSSNKSMTSTGAGVLGAKLSRCIWL